MDAYTLTLAIVGLILLFLLASMRLMLRSLERTRLRLQHSAGILDWACEDAEDGEPVNEAGRTNSRTTVSGTEADGSNANADAHDPERNPSDGTRPRPPVDDRHTPSRWIRSGFQTDGRVAHPSVEPDDERLLDHRPQQGDEGDDRVQCHDRQDRIRPPAHAVSVPAYDAV